MRKPALFVLLLLSGMILLTSCRTRKKGCPQPKRNWGAEKVLDELNKPGKH
ncbi:hypothetical protein [Chitinophaga nivalis]|uniref:Uncharacterized protein n=1 Tax=Chitinophaga nivalis TaxID=2991709 RepID=A0ABT3IUA0_9BACT|nr:hypothetical protein [Chitinophaga nivalis]MCW3462745.1 hypothetical protein [Chitinophaga nivalis]MCW3487564.1 hypothetical protein [Chitinophaga nivalis]